jgi:DNA polymerase-1
MSKKEAKKRLILLDAHAILHRAYHALPDFSTAKGEPTGALYGLSTMLIKIIEDLKPDYIVACYDVKGPTYRHEAYKEYKAGRVAAEDDLVAQMNSSRNIFFALNIPIYDKQGFEADDMLGTIVEQLKDRVGEIEIIIASGDMDTLQLVRGDEVKVYTLKKGIKDTIMYDEEAVIARFGFGPKLIPDYKGLRGDPSDNIIGVKGIGEKTATILITTFGTIENMYKELEAGNEEKFKSAGITPRIIQLLKDNKEEAEFSKMLATIRLDSPITFVLPEKTFKEDLDMKKIGGLWHELEFRTLTARLEKAVTGNLSFANMGADGSGGSVGGNFESDAHGSGEASSEHSAKKVIDVPKDDFEKTALALWLVDSGITNPQMEDVVNFANKGDYEEAKKAIYIELDKKNLRKVYEEIELPLIPITKKMEERGIKIDRKLLTHLGETYHAEVARLEKKIHELAGTEFNISSPKQLGEILFDKLELVGKNMKKTSGGARSTKESELEKLRDLHPIVPLIFEYRELSKLLSTYIDAIPPLLDEKDRLHSHFVSAGTTTGRMASIDPNLQNIPVKTELGKAIRGAFVASEGYKLCSFDYSQIELRIAAFLSGDEKLLEIFRKGEDVHTSVASFVFKVSPEQVTSDMRRKAKVINFGIIYGMGVLALKQNLGTSRDDAQKFLNDYFETFSGLANYLNNVKAETARKGYTETFFGRRRYFEGINSKIPYIKASAERMAINAPIQGTEADVIKLAMIAIHKYIKENKLDEAVHPLLQVHDELVYEIKEDKAEEVATQIEKIMESVMDPNDTKGVVLKASKVIGNNWGELK